MFFFFVRDDPGKKRGAHNTQFETHVVLFLDWFNIKESSKKYQLKIDGERERERTEFWFL